MLQRYLPIFQWLPRYKKGDFPGDLSAGITVGVMLVPQGMAYALIAGLPPIYGLYAALVPNIVYAVMGSSRKLAVGPVALDALIVASSLSAMKLAGPNEYLSMALFLAFMVGALQLLMGFLRMGFLANFLSRPVVSGFTSAAALVIAVNQLKYLFGLSIEGKGTFSTFLAIVQNLGGTNGYDLSIGIGSILVILGLKKVHRKLPAAVVVVVLSIVGIYLFMAKETDVHILGSLPTGLPSFAFPNVAISQFTLTLPTALALAFIGFAEAMTIAKGMEEKTGGAFTDANQELRALGSANLIGSFFQSFPVNASFSRTAVNVDEGAKTGMASLVSAGIVAITLLFFTPFFYYLPKAVLGAIILVAVFGLIDLQYPRELFKAQKEEFIVWLLTFLTTLFIGVSQGILFGVLFSLVLLVYRTSKPHMAVLGKIKGMEYFKNIDRFGDDAEIHDEILMIRFDAQLFFANVDYFKSALMDEVRKKGPALKYVILNAEPVNYLDGTAAKQLQGVIQQLRDQGVVFKLAGAIGPLRDRLQTSGLIEVIGQKNIYVRTAEAYEDSLKGIERTALQEKVSLQFK